jgi:hypothetical protein
MAAELGESMAEKRDDAYDAKHKIKEGTRRDLAMDKKRGLPIDADDRPKAAPRAGRSMFDVKPGEPLPHEHKFKKR